MPAYKQIPDFVVDQLFGAINANQLNSSVKNLFQDVFQNPTGNFITTTRIAPNGEIRFNADAGGTEKIVNSSSQSKMCMVGANFEQALPSSFRLIGERMFIMTQLAGSNTNAAFWPIKGFIPQQNFGIPLPFKCSLVKWNHSMVISGFVGAGAVRQSAYRNEVLAFSLANLNVTANGVANLSFSSFNRAVNNWALDERFSVGFTVPSGTFSATVTNLIEFSTEP